MMAGNLLTEFVLPAAVIISAASASATATFAWKTWQAVKVHDRALFGEEAVNGHEGVIEVVNENSELSERNRKVLRQHGLVGHVEDVHEDGEERFAP